MSARSWLVLGVVAGLFGCGTTDEGATAKTAPEHVGAQRQFLNWSPSQALLNEHTQWHSGPCGAAGARVCEGRFDKYGAEFLTFHRNFLKRLRDDAVAKGVPASELTPWKPNPFSPGSAFPSEIRATSAWISNNLGVREANIQAFVNDAGARFASLEEFGDYVELMVHNYLHDAAYQAYPNDSLIRDVPTSPSNTYFFKIHGWVEWQFQRFQQGDLNKDGHSDLIYRNPATGASAIQPMTGTTTLGSPISIGGYNDACQWYIGGTADVDFNGSTDIIWHGPGCSLLRVMPMQLVNSTAQYPTAYQASGPGSNRQLIGAADFDHDMRPDLVWRDTTTNQVWFSTLTNFIDIQSTVGPVPTAAGYVPVAVADVNRNADFDVIYERADVNFKEYYWQMFMGFSSYSSNMNKLVTAAPPLGPGQSIKTPLSASVGAVGRFQSGVGNSLADLVFNRAGSTYSFACEQGNTGTFYSEPLGGTLPAGSVLQAAR